MSRTVLAGLTRRNWVRETGAGVTLAAIAIPLNIGYAQIAGLPPATGLYSMIIPAAVYALLVSSRQLVASPDAAAAALVSSTLTGLTSDPKTYVQMALAQALVGAAIFGLFAVFRLGFIANFLSAPILVGFVAGLAFEILISQVAKMLGISLESHLELPEKLVQLVGSLHTANHWSILIAAGSILVLVLGRRFARTVPWALVVLVVSTAVLLWLGLADAGVKVLGAVSAGVPELTWPQLNLQQWLQVVPSALALTLVTIAEGLLVARRYAEQHGQTVHPNRDLMAFAAANAASGVSGGFTIGSSASRTAAMDQAGARTQLPSLVAAGATLLVVCFGTALLADVPAPAIGAIVAVAVTPLLGVPEFVRLWRLRRFEFAIAAVCAVVTLTLGPIIGVLVAFVLSLVDVVRRAAAPTVDVLAATGSVTDAFRAARDGSVLTAPGVVIVRFAGPVFFGNAQRFATAVRTAVQAAAEHGAQHLVLDCEAITGIDTTAADTMSKTLDWCRATGLTVAFSRLRADLRLELDQFDLLRGAETYFSNAAAVAALQTRGPE